MPDWLENAVFYEVYPPSFKDSNGDGIGDLPGLIEKLDYIQSLGCNAIWLNPCFESPFMDAGYDISDYYRVAPRYGDNDDLKRLFNEAHCRGMHVLLDLVPGHTSYLHSWFRESASPQRNKYTDWYIWTNNVWEDSAGFRSVNGMYDRDGNYIVNFFSSQPALNYGFARRERDWQLPVDHPAVLEVREELKRIMRFWLDMGADGYRVDMAFSLVKNDENHCETIRFWQEIRQMLDREYPKAAIVSEWSLPSEAIEAGFHMDFYLHFNVLGYNALFRSQKFNGISVMPDFNCFFDAAGSGDATVFCDEFLPYYKQTRDKGFICLPTGNHDMIRLSQGRSRRQMELAFLFLLTMPGVPFIYYGDEIGMRYIEGLTSKEGGYFRTGSRTPMQWDRSPNAGFSTAPANRLYLPVDPALDFPDVASQETAPESLLNLVRRLIEFRKSSPALTASGDFTVYHAVKNQYPLIYGRQWGDERYLIAVNPSAKPARAAIHTNFQTYEVAMESSPGEVSVSRTARGECAFEMPGESYVVLKMY